MLMEYIGSHKNKLLVSSNSIYVVLLQISKSERNTIGARLPTSSLFGGFILKVSP